MKHLNHLRKPIVAVALIGVLAVGTAAATAYQTISAALRPDITVELNGKEQTMKDVNGKEVYPISYNGSTYLPIRAIGEALGLTVNWDSATQTVDLTGSAVTDSTAGGTYIGGDKAKEIALKDAGYTASQVTMVRLSNDWEDGRMVYDVEFYVNKAEYDYEIDAITGTILEKDKDIDNFTIPTTSAGITLNRAKEIALADAGVSEANATFTKAKQDYDDGRLVYDVEFYCQNAKWEYEILASDGTILSRDCDGYGTGTGNNYGNGTGICTSDCDNTGHHHGYGNGTSSTASLTSDQAKNIAFQHAGVSSNAVSALRAELDYDDGRLEYEVEFRANGLEYEYKIDANSGTILDFEWD